MRRFLVCAVLVMCGAGAQTAFAQGRTDTAFVSVNVGTQVNTQRLSQTIKLEKHAEPAPVTATMAEKAVPFFDFGLTLRIIGNLGASVALSHLSDTGAADVSADIPHPFYLGRPRPIQGQTPGVRHKEMVFHTNAAYVIPSESITLVLSGGLSFFSADQDFVTDIAFTESYPYDEAKFSSATLTRASGRKTGYNAAADVTWKVGASWGVGGVIRFSRAKVPFTSGATKFGTFNLGGLQAGGGLRLMF
jgi:hypothetical protein